MANKKRTILVIEDNELNREMLSMILLPYYDIVEAENGEVGLNKLNEYKSKISLILLDLQMPVMDGYEFLKAVQKLNRYSNIPIIVTTSSEKVTDEISCLEMGASDFITKPYNSDIVLKRIGSMIRLSEASSIINRTEYDDITELYSKEFFYVYAEKLLGEDHTNNYDMVCLEIDSLKFLKERHGELKLVELFAKLSNYIKSIPGSVCGLLQKGRFAMLIPHKDMDYYTNLVEGINLEVKSSPISNAIVKLGVYKNVNHELSASNICDNAMLAIDNIKDMYLERIAEYDEDLKEKLIRRQIIVDSMDLGLSENQFEVYYQPKYDLTHDKIGGAEALIRWHHPELGFLPPGEFIPVFEQNGFIAKLDLYIAERVCSDISSWKKRGLNVVPVSVNVSRIDFENKKLASTLEEIVKKYDIDFDCIHFEVTESAYSRNPQQIKNGALALRNMGFKIEIDDFGAGYSSLRVLDDLEFDVLKLDMSLVSDKISDKRRCVLENVLSLAEKLGVDVVAEGIETQEQAVSFKDLGCKYGQGYYYSRPIKRADFEQFLAK